MAAIEALGNTWGLVTPLRITEGITNRHLSRLLKDASLEAAELLERNVPRLGTVSGKVTNAQMEAAIRGIAPLSTELWNGVGNVTSQGIAQMGAAAGDQALDLDLLMGMPGTALLQYAPQAVFAAEQAVQDILSRRTAGFTLSDRIYANGKVSVRQVERIIEKNLVLQRSAKDIAREVRKFYDPKVPGGASYAAMRLGRTEINNAHHETTKRLAQDKPWVIGMKWNLSRSHPKPDPCDAYAVHDEGLGQGVFRSAPSKPHPQCFCWLTHVHEDTETFTNKLSSGQYDDWLDERGVVC